MKLQDARTLTPSQLEDRRKQAVLLRKQGLTYAEIGVIVDVGRNKVSEWVKKWQEGGSKALKVGKPGRPKGVGSSLNEAQQKKVQQCLKNTMPDQLMLPFALWTRQAVVLLIKDLFHFDMPIRTVGDYLKRWGFTPQKPVRRAYERCDKAVKQWLKEEYPSIEQRAKKEGAEIHWGDETGVCSADQVGRCYAAKGKTPVSEHRGAPERINMISSVTNRGKMRFMFYEGSMNAEFLIKFLGRLIKSAKKKVYLILDNLRVHHAKIVKAWLASREDKIEIHYLPSYSPDLNPDEYFNRDLKSELSKRPSLRGKAKFKEQVKTQVRSLAKRPTRIQKYFNSSKISYAARFSAPLTITRR